MSNQETRSQLSSSSDCLNEVASVQRINARSAFLIGEPGEPAQPGAFSIMPVRRTLHRAKACMWERTRTPVCRPSPG